MDESWTSPPTDEACPLLQGCQQDHPGAIPQSLQPGSGEVRRAEGTLRDATTAAEGISSFPRWYSFIME